MFSAFLAVLIAAGPIQLTFTTAVSAPTAKPGQTLKLFVDVTPKQKMHVYAPGVEGYIPIEWKIKNSEAWATHPVSYPSAEKLFLKAINETVPLFSRFL